ncbi:hypothetical protein EVAR_22713_1 [Eumeta japonica]|uniref:Uncharacterized protein n=1 Tax=Eumeta variegata TaxID=151549 RepID=A0A4C1US94_EUMVA|nr:hypothetical protein EVAR_22713_1 [Eumeta japonica]
MTTRKTREALPDSWDGKEYLSGWQRGEAEATSDLSFTERTSVFYENVTSSNNGPMIPDHSPNQKTALRRPPRSDCHPSLPTPAIYECLITGVKLTTPRSGGPVNGRLEARQSSGASRRAQS